jgi:hypothetical protein
MEEGEKGKEIFHWKLKMNRRNWAFWPYHCLFLNYHFVTEEWATTRLELCLSGNPTERFGILRRIGVSNH